VLNEGPRNEGPRKEGPRNKGLRKEVQNLGYAHPQKYMRNLKLQKIISVRFT
jgi:hypothetical protein